TLETALDDGFRVNNVEVVFVGFALGLHKLRRDQSHLVPLLEQQTAQTVRSGTSSRPRIKMMVSERENFLQEELCCALPTQPGERCSCPDPCRLMQYALR